ncbi:MAG: hypothetical protein LUD15_14925 [Bacteroides sp.]|nr:hypothetical protein [Bacteroides sp.]
MYNRQFPFELPEFKPLEDKPGYDSISYTINSSVNKDFEVIPYYKISDLDASLAGEREL